MQLLNIKNDFFKIIQPGNLYWGALVFICGTSVVVFLIYLKLSRKKRYFKREQTIITILETGLSEVLAGDQSDEIYFSSTLLRRFAKRDSDKQIIIDQLINIKKSLSGSAAQASIKLYEELGLHKVSESKFQSNSPVKKAKGIYELYQMERAEMLPRISTLINHRSELVRNEVQTALIAFQGAKGLSFLDILKAPLSEWQQVKLLERLNNQSNVLFEDVARWLQSENVSVVVFSLKLVEIYQQYQVHDEVARCIYIADVIIQKYAVKALGNIAAEKTPEVLKAIYFTAHDEVKKEILLQFNRLSSANDQGFLQKVIANEKGELKLLACRAFVRSDDNAIEKLGSIIKDRPALASCYFRPAKT